MNKRLLIILTLFLVLSILFSLIFIPIKVSRETKNDFPKINPPKTKPGEGLKAPTSPPPTK